jgi:hypothetical protein
VPVQRDFCPSLAALVGPVQNILFFIVHYFTSFVPIAQQAMQAVVPRRLSLNIFLLGTFCLACGTCSLEERGLVEACVVHIGELVELVRHLTHVVALSVIQLTPLTLHRGGYRRPINPNLYSGRSKS